MVQWLDEQLRIWTISGLILFWYKPLFVCRACLATWRCKSSTQPDGGEVLAKRKSVAVRLLTLLTWRRCDLMQQVYISPAMTRGTGFFGGTRLFCTTTDRFEELSESHLCPRNIHVVYVNLAPFHIEEGFPTFEADCAKTCCCGKKRPEIFAYFRVYI